jgi:hypothetical protein
MLTNPWFIGYLAIAAGSAWWAYRHYSADNPLTRPTVEMLRDRGKSEAQIRRSLIGGDIFVGLIWPVSIPVEIVDQVKRRRAAKAGRSADTDDDV